MNYQIIINKSTTKEIKKLELNIRNRIISEINELITNPNPEGSKKLKIKDGYRIRVSDYRILYTINQDHKIVTIYKVAPRKDVYK